MINYLLLADIQGALRTFYYKSGILYRFPIAINIPMFSQMEKSVVFSAELCSFSDSN